MLGPDFSKQQWRRDVADSLRRSADADEAQNGILTQILQELIRMQNKTITTGRIFLGTPVSQ
jgi:uncharacterized membrane-anchored protein